MTEPDPYAKPEGGYVSIWAIPKDEPDPWCHHLLIRAAYAMLEAGKIPEANVLKILDDDSLREIIAYSDPNGTTPYLAPHRPREG